MKKLSLLLVCVMVFFLVGCEEKTGQIVCTLSSNDAVNGYQLSSNYKINYKGDVVESVETIEVVTSDSEEILDTFETTLNSTYNQMNSVYGGYTYEVTRADNTVTSNVVINYNDMNLEQLIADQPAYKSYAKDNKLLVEGVQAIYEGMGATCN